MAKLKISDLLKEGEISTQSKLDSNGIILFEGKEYPFEGSEERNTFKKGTRVWFLGTDPNERKLSVGYICKANFFTPRPKLIEIIEDGNSPTPSGTGTVSDIPPPPSVRIDGPNLGQREYSYFHHINQSIAKHKCEFQLDPLDYISFDDDPQNPGEIRNVKINEKGMWIY